TYRVVFLGTFNVGKSTAINAFLGGAYLPMDVEECTSKLTFIQRGEQLALSLTLSEPASEHEQEALQSVLQDIPTRMDASDDGHKITILYEGNDPAWMQKSLEPLVTVMADETYPHLAPLRDKIEDLSISLPSDVLEEDIVFVDTPGVHSVSETRQEITYGIIERSHLVISFVDSGFAGNIHDLNFIKRIIKWRGRRVFFVLNKADKLESHEIDIRGGRGPARSLIEAFGRHEIPEDSEIFYFSGYRALRAQQLAQGHITLESVQDDNKVSIPTSIAERVEESDNPARDLSAYLMGQSRLPHLKERLLDYLLNENKAGAVLETALRFVGERADDYVASLENELNLAKDPTKFEELRANQDALKTRLDAIRASSDQVLNRYKAQCKGGQLDGKDFKGYEAQFREGMTNEIIQASIIQPILEWLRTDGNLKKSRRQKFKPLSAQLEHQVDEFVSGIMVEIQKTIDSAEQEARNSIMEQLGQIRGLRVHMTEPGGMEGIALETSMTKSYLTCGGSGALVGATAGAVVGSAFFGIGAAIGAGVGGLVGAVGGFLTRLAWSEERWLKKLEPIIHENVMNMLIHGTKDKQGLREAPILESVVDYLARRGDAFYDAVQEEVDNAIQAVQNECDDLLAREEQIRAESDAIIARLDPKVTVLHDLRSRAAVTVTAVYGGESVRV
ncbi:MAG: dynamin family protein, partial [Candidatus Hydrogenedentes bacterium]|nr:dynamin family protein [Candidatus Hydrogenedentota bacterium]